MKNIIKKYVDNLKEKDIENYIEKNNLDININDIKTIYIYIKKYWEDLYNKNTKVLDNIKKEVHENTYTTLIYLYNKYVKYL